MKVKRSQKSDTYFNLIKPGDIFEFDSNIYMKVKNIYYGVASNKLINAIEITTGGNSIFEDFCRVIPIHGSFVENNEEIN